MRDRISRRSTLKLVGTATALALAPAALPCPTADARPATLRFTRPTPTPKSAQVCHIEQRGGLGALTVIARQWVDGGRRDCGLCPGRKCTLDSGLCMVSVGQLVPIADCLAFAMPPEK